MKLDTPRRSVRVALALIALLAAVEVACGGGDEPLRIATAAGAEPSAAPDLGTATAEATPTAAPVVTIPERPENLFAGGLLVAGYLRSAAADRADCLPQLVAAWQLAPVKGERCAVLDLDGDGHADYAYVIRAPGDLDTAPADAWLFAADEDGTDRLAATARQLSNRLTVDVRLLAVADLTGDGLDEVVMSWRSCDPEPCVGRLLIASAHRGRIEDLAPGDLDLGDTATIEVRDASGDGLLDLVVADVTPPPPPPGVVAGPVRAATVTLSWGGIRFFESREPEPPAYLIQAIDDADRAFQAGDYPAARDQYQRAAIDGSLLDWRAEVGLGSSRTELAPYAWFRAALAAERTGDETGARTLLQTAINGHSGSLLALAATTYLGARAAGTPPPEACTLVESVLATRLEEWARIWDYGTAIAPRTTAELCR